MKGRATQNRWEQPLRYCAGGLLCLLAIAGLISGGRWFWSLISLCAAYLIVLGRRRIFRPGITRAADEIVCRYLPWYEGNAIFGCVLLPLMGVAAVAAGYTPGNPSWLRFVGGVLLLVTPLSVYSVVSMWRRCILVISESALMVRLAGPKDELTTIPRRSILSISPKMVPNGVSGESLQVKIDYASQDSTGDSAKTVLLGLQLTVRPVDLPNALSTWNEGASDPSELMDRVERILRGRPAVIE